MQLRTKPGNGASLGMGLAWELGHATSMQPGNGAVQPGNGAMQPGNGAMQPGDEAVQPGNKAMLAV